MYKKIGFFFVAFIVLLVVFFNIILPAILSNTKDYTFSSSGEVTVTSGFLIRVVSEAGNNVYSNTPVTIVSCKRERIQIKYLAWVHEPTIVTFDPRKESGGFISVGC